MENLNGFDSWIVYRYTIFNKIILQFDFRSNFLFFNYSYFVKILFFMTYEFGPYPVCQKQYELVGPLNYHKIRIK